GISCRYEYDAETFRPRRRIGERANAQGGKDTLQDLAFTYDAAGNLTHVEDAAQKTIFFRNQVVPASADYTYDAIYRLIEASGREHLGQVGGAPLPATHDDAARMVRPQPGDGQAMGRYVQRFRYDKAGNLLELRHA